MTSGCTKCPKCGQETLQPFPSRGRAYCLDMACGYIEQPPKNPLSTKEQREELRRQFKETGMVPINVRQALDGLDIAEEMAEQLAVDSHASLAPQKGCGGCAALRRWEVWRRPSD